MGISDYILMTLIAGGALYLLYRSLWKKKGRCAGCCYAGECETGETKKSCK